MKLLPLVLVLASCLAARARLGDAITDCDQRYNGGKPGQSSAADLIKPLLSGPGVTNLTYIHNGFTIRVGFRDSVAVAIDYNKMGSQKITPQELEAILDANGGGWGDVPDYSARRSWKGVDEMSALAGNKGRVWMRYPDHSAAGLYNLGRSLRMKINVVILPGAARHEGGPGPAKKAGGPEKF